MDYNIYKKSIEEKNKAFDKWESDNFIFKSFSKILHKKILELKPKFSNILLISSDLNETIDEISKIKCKNLIYLSQYEIFKKELCISPIPTLSIHCTNINSIYGLSPNINWKKIWDENKID